MVNTQIHSQYVAHYEFGIPPRISRSSAAFLRVQPESKCPRRHRRLQHWSVSATDRLADKIVSKAGYQRDKAIWSSIKCILWHWPEYYCQYLVYVSRWLERVCGIGLLQNAFLYIARLTWTFRSISRLPIKNGRDRSHDSNAEEGDGIIILRFNMPNIKCKRARLLVFAYA